MARVEVLPPKPAAWCWGGGLKLSGVAWPPTGPSSFKEEGEVVRGALGFPCITRPPRLPQTPTPIFTRKLAPIGCASLNQSCPSYACPLSTECHPR